MFKLWKVAVFGRLDLSRNASGSFSMEIVTTDSAELRDAPLPRVEPNQRSTPPSSPPQACVHVYLRQDFRAFKELLRAFRDVLRGF